MFTSPGPCGELQPPQYVLKGQHRGQKQFRRFLEWVEDNFLLQVIEEPPRRDAVLALFSPTRRGTWTSGAAGLHWPWRGGVWDPTGSKRHTQQSSLPWTKGEQASGIYLVESYGIKLWREEGPGQLVNTQGLPPPNSGVIFPKKEKVRWTH